VRSRLRHLVYTLAFVAILGGGTYLANKSLGSAALMVALGLAISPSFSSTVQSALAGLQLRQEDIIRLGSIILWAAPDGVRAGEVVSMRWRIVEIRCKDGAVIPIPNSALTGSSPPVLGNWPAPPPPTS
jgi:small-conductance mechanosensitive channel